MVTQAARSAYEYVSDPLGAYSRAMKKAISVGVEIYEWSQENLNWQAIQQKRKIAGLIYYGGNRILAASGLPSLEPPSLFSTRALLTPLPLTAGLVGLEAIVIRPSEAELNNFLRTVETVVPALVHDLAAAVAGESSYVGGYIAGTVVYEVLEGAAVAAVTAGVGLAYKAPKAGLVATRVATKLQKLGKLEDLSTIVRKIESVLSNLKLGGKAKLASRSESSTARRTTAHAADVLTHGRAARRVEKRARKARVASREGFGSGGFWNRIDEAVDPSVVRQLNPGSCGPACGATLLRGTGNPAAQSAIALRQGAVMSDDAARLANLMNELAGTSGVWKGGFINVITNPRRVFSVLIRNGSFATTLRTPPMKVSHMVVADGLDDAGRVIIRDASTGTRYLITWDDFVKVCEGQSVYR